jgi:hypothetical protein
MTQPPGPRSPPKSKPKMKPQPLTTHGRDAGAGAPGGGALRPRFRQRLPAGPLRTQPRPRVSCGTDRERAPPFAKDYMLERRGTARLCEWPVLASLPPPHDRSSLAFAQGLIGRPMSDRGVLGSASNACPGRASTAWAPNGVEQHKPRPVVAKNSSSWVWRQDRGHTAAR